MNWKAITLSCFWLMIPILAWNGVFMEKLAHPAFQADENVPGWVLIFENILRIGIMAWPLFLKMGSKTTLHRWGWVLYGVGLVLYFGSWFPLMNAPQSIWSNHLLGFTAPATLPLLWLLGIGLIGGSWPYMILSLLFVSVHAGHWVLAFRSIN
jgi:hypothetical protein